jgi:DNA helicase-2/ATP-dependent DNA helicase PcrA
VRLEQNYRSTEIILEAANGLIARNAGRLGKNLWTEGERGEPITLYAGFNEQDEARYIVEQAETWAGDGHPRRSIAILYRSNAQSRVLEEALLREGIPYRIYGGQRFYERLEIRNALAYLRLAQTRDDDPALERVLNTPPRGIGSKTVEKLREVARAEQISLWRAIHRVREQSLLPARALTALAQFQSLIDDLDRASETLPLEELTEHVIEVSGLLDYHRAEKGERGQARVENLQELQTATRLFEAEDETISPLQAFLDSAALDAGEGQADPYEDSIQMMTLHSAKGLEFPLVFIAGMEENLFPHQMSLEEPGRLEEERRLAYVGITRAMKKLIVTYAENRRLYGGDMYNTPSRFIREIPGDLIEEVRLNGAISRPMGSLAHAALAEPPAEGIELGRLVLHQVFGEGVVTQFEGQGGNARVEVSFSEGSKWLVLQYANLTIL